MPIIAAVAVLVRLTEQTPVRHAEHLHRLGEFSEPVFAQAVLVVRCQVLGVLEQNLPLLAEGARHQRDLHALLDVSGHQRPGRDRFVVGMRMHDEQSSVGHDP
ncbi:MAG: hypothetical protein V9G09_08870 [Candidatus Nanopelagicales bacterium]